MFRYILIISFSLVILSCATNSPQNIDKPPTLEERIDTAQMKVRLVLPASENWCTADDGCVSLGQLTCVVYVEDAEKGIDKCHKKLREQTVSLGGDTFVLQDTGEPTGQFDTQVMIRAYGKAYDCTGVNKALGQESAKSGRLPRKIGYDIYHSDYFLKCGLASACKKFMDSNCSSIQQDGFTKCILKYQKNMNSGMESFNSLIIKQDLYNKMGIYRVLGQTFQCNL